MPVENFRTKRGINPLTNWTNKISGQRDQGKLRYNLKKRPEQHSNLQTGVKRISGVLVRRNHNQSVRYRTDASGWCGRQWWRGKERDRRRRDKRSHNNITNKAEQQCPYTSGKLLFYMLKIHLIMFHCKEIKGEVLSAILTCIRKSIRLDSTFFVILPPLTLNLTPFD